MLGGATIRANEQTINKYKIILHTILHKYFMFVTTQINQILEIPIVLKLLR